jgi:vacuolar-type H+-ATPase subunit H
MNDKSQIQKKGSGDPSENLSCAETRELSSGPVDEVDSQITHTTVSIPDEREKSRHEAQPAVTDLLAKSHFELEALLAETHKIHERSWRVIQSLLQDLELKAWQAVDAAVSGVKNKIHDRLSFETTAVLENFDVEADARLGARIDQLLAKTSEIQRGAERDLSTLVANKREQVIGISARGIKELQQLENSATANLRSEARTQVDAYKETVDTAMNNLRRVVARVSTELESLTGGVLETFQSKLERIGEEVVKQTEQRITDMTQTSLATVVKLAREVLDREISSFLVHTLRERIERLAETFGRPNLADSGNKPGPGEAQEELQAPAIPRSERLLAVRLGSNDGNSSDRKAQGDAELLPKPNARL